mgnify:CR=1 FL=1
MKINNAIISCYDKTGLKEFVSKLVEYNPSIKIFSSSGTFRELESVAKDNLFEVAEYTGFPEMPGGLVKTLHPKVHAGLLADLSDEEHKKYLEENNIEAFDLVVVNLYPFEKVASEGADLETARQNIDIGGVSLIEAGAKNFKRVTVVTDPSDYDKVLQESERLDLAKKAFAHLAHYFNEINNYFSKQ